MMGMTKRQSDLLKYIRAYRDSHDGLMPSYTEMCFGIGLRSKSGISRMVDAMVSLGVLRRQKNAARALEIVADNAMTPETSIALKVYCERTGYAPSAVVANALAAYFTAHPMPTERTEP